MKKTGIFYGPEKGSVAKVAKLIAEKLGTDKTDLHLVKDSNISTINAYNQIILGISTIGTTNWDSEHTDTDWDTFFTQLNKADWKGKTVAIFSLGDHINYPDHFVDAIGWVYQRLKPLQANIVGFCNTDDYHFNESEGIVEGKFAGLPLDEDNESEKTDERLNKWLDQLKTKNSF
jgi:flavodoxin I